MKAAEVEGGEGAGKGVGGREVGGGVGVTEGDMDGGTHR